MFRSGIARPGGGATVCMRLAAKLHHVPATQEEFDAGSSGDALARDAASRGAVLAEPL